MNNCPQCGYDLNSEPSDSDWISVEDYLPTDRQKVDIKGVPIGRVHPLIITIVYHDSVGFITNITHWRPHVA